MASRLRLRSFRSITAGLAFAAFLLAFDKDTTLAAVAAAPAVEDTPSAPVASSGKTDESAKPALYTATLRPERDAPDSTAYGTATLLLASDGLSAQVTVSYSNLTSRPVSSYLKLGVPGGPGAFLQRIPEGATVNFTWNVRATGEFSTADLQQAVKDGRIYIGINSRQYPEGELRGQFIRATGSQTFVAPPRPPALPNTPPTPQDAARFLTQATFGPTREEIDDVVKRGYARWLFEQMAIPPSSHLEQAREDFQRFPPGPKVKNPRVSNANRQAAWWNVVVHGRDQLRQRVAFALSEILVVSDQNGGLGNQAEALANYYDMLARDAFGNFRDLLEDVSLSPVMGTYLSHLKNAKADPKKGTSPDENYAREVMQLFTIGLNQLQPDGTLKLGDDGLPIPTYDQTTITETARVFTGWGFYSAAPKPNFGGGFPNYFSPMMLYPAMHDDGEKTIVGGAKLPAGQGGRRDLDQTLDTLFNHPNTAPFICRQLIQRLVTSNPSPGYVFRVARVFARNSEGVRGDLGAVVRAILLDHEARATQLTANLGYGKLKEPLLRMTALLRAFDGSTANGRYPLLNPEGAFGEAALRSPTVFNFFEPDYVQPGELAAAGLRAPEYQIYTDTTAITIPNQLHNVIYTPAQPRENMITLKLDALLPLARTPGPLLDELDLIFCAGALGDKARAQITAALEKLPPGASDLERVRCALDLVVTSPEAAIQK